MGLTNEENVFLQEYLKIVDQAGIFLNKKALCPYDVREFEYFNEYAWYYVQEKQKGLESRLIPTNIYELYNGQPDELRMDSILLMFVHMQSSHD